MIKIENAEVMGWGHAIRGMRNPMNSWARSDSPIERSAGDFVVGENDLDLMNRLAKGGSVHAKYRRMLVVYCDVTAPLYWWKEADTYKVGTVANSCSTMHRIHAKEFVLDDFSCESLEWDTSAMKWMYDTIEQLNRSRKMYLSIDAGHDPALVGIKKRWWMNMIQMLPSSYNQRRTLMLNYEVLSNIYFSRKDHKLDEWRQFCKWIETLPYSKELIQVSKTYD